MQSKTIIRFFGKDYTYLVTETPAEIMKLDLEANGAKIMLTTYHHPKGKTLIEVDMKEVEELVPMPF